MCQFYRTQGAKPTAYLVSTMRLQRRRDIENWSYPSGLQRFSHAAALLLGAVPKSTNLLVAPCGTKKTAGNAGER